jgi:hypothetical protein
MYNQQQDSPENYWSTQQDQEQNFEQFMRQNDPNGGTNQPRGHDTYGRGVGQTPRPTARSSAPSLQRETASPLGRPRSQFDPSTTHDPSMRQSLPSQPPPGVGMGIMDGDESSASSDQKPPAVKMQVVGVGLHEPPMQAPYESMVQHQSREEEARREARREASGLPVAETTGTPSAPLPTPYSAPPQPPNQKPVEPAMPHSRLGRRCLTHKPKREPELVKGLVVNNMSGSRANRPRSQIQVSCAKCGAALQISKNAIAVSCPGCYMISPASSCIVFTR